MVVFLEDRQCQVPAPRASKWINLFCFEQWWSYSRIENVKYLHHGQVNGKKYDYGVQLWNATIEYEITNMVCHYSYGMLGNRHLVDPTP